MKRSIIIFLLVALGAVAGFVGLIKNEPVFSKETTVYMAIPENTPFFAEFSSIKSIVQDNPLIQELKSAGIGRSFFEWQEKLDTLISGQHDIQKSLLHQPFILVFHFGNDSVLKPLFIKKTTSRSEQKSIEKLVRNLFPEEGKLYEKRMYNDRKIISATSPDSKSSVYYCFTDRLFLASPESFLLEQAITQLETPGLPANRHFVKVNKSATGQADLSWYVNHPGFSRYLAAFLKKELPEGITGLGEKRESAREQGQAFGNYAAWSELDIKIGEHNIVMNGISTADDSLNHFLNVFAGQTPVRFEADNVLPKNTSFFCSFTFSDKDLFFENLENYFERSASYQKRVKMFAKTDSTFNSDLKVWLKQTVKNEVTVATTSVSPGADGKTTYFIIQTDSDTFATGQINRLLASYAAEKEIDVNTLKSNYSVDENNRFTVYRFPFPSFPGAWLGNPFTLAEANFVATNGNFLIFCNSETGIQEYLRNRISESSLARNLNYAAFKENLLSAANINVYVDVTRSFRSVTEIFTPEFSRSLLEKEESLRKIPAVNWQVLSDRDFFFNSILIGFDKNVREEAPADWQCLSENGVRIKPQIVTNHTDPVNREVILQDSRNNLLLVSNEGLIRWSFSVSEPIISEIFQVDYFKNGKLQFLFNTRTRLFLIDRNGNPVVGFPVTLRSPATNSVNVFDYDNSRNYRYFVACEDKRIYAYDFAGKIVSGWNFGQTGSEVTTPVQHFRVEGKDYIIFKDKSRVYIQDRQGKMRVKTPIEFENSRNPLVLNLNGKPKIVATDISGKVFYLWFDGKYNEKGSRSYSSNHFFTVDDINGDRVPDFIFLDENELTVTDEKGKVLFTEKFENPIPFKPNVYHFEQDIKKVGVVDSATNRIYLFSADGKLYDGFPLPGNSEFSIGKMSENSSGLNLVVGSGKGVLKNYLLK